MPGTWKDSHPTVHLVIGRQTSVQAVELAKACELAPFPLSHGLGVEIMDSGRYQWIRMPLWKSKFPKKSFSIPLEEKKVNLDALEWVRGMT